LQEVAAELDPQEEDLRNRLDQLKDVGREVADLQAMLENLKLQVGEAERESARLDELTKQSKRERQRLETLRSEDLPRRQKQLEQARQKLDAIAAGEIESQIESLAREIARVEDELKEARAREPRLSAQQRELKLLLDQHAEVCQRVEHLAAQDLDQQISEGESALSAANESLKLIQTTFDSVTAARDALRRSRAAVPELLPTASTNFVLQRLTEIERGVEAEVQASLSTQPLKQQAACRRRVRRLERKLARLCQELQPTRRRGWLRSLFGGQS